MPALGQARVRVKGIPNAQAFAPVTAFLHRDVNAAANIRYILVHYRAYHQRPFFNRADNDIVVPQGMIDPHGAPTTGDHAHITSSALHTAPAGPALTDVSPCSSFPLSWPFSAGLVADASNDCATAMIVSTCSVLRPVWIRCCWNMSPPCQIIGCDIARLREALAELSITVSEPEK